MDEKCYIKIIETEEELCEFYDACCKSTQDKSINIPDIVISVPYISDTQIQFFQMCGVDTLYNNITCVIKHRLFERLYRRINS